MRRIGIDVGGTKINIGVLDEYNNICGRVEAKLPPDKSAEGIAEFIGKLLKTHFSEMPISCAGVGIPGTVDSTGRIARKVPNIGWDNVNFADILEKHIGIPVTLIQDSRAAAFGEYMAGAGQNRNVLVCVTLGTGIGTGIVINGSIFDGGLGASGEIGHLPSGDEGRECGCGKKDCMECYAAGKGIELSAKKVFGEELSCNEVFELANNGDIRAGKIIEDAVQRLGKAMISIINLLSPDALLFSGGISRQKELFVNPLIDYIEKHCYSTNGELPFIGAAKLGPDAPMVGAALAAKCRAKSKGKISASMMCADMLHMEEDVRELEKNDVQMLHFDVMDGHFVPNLMLPAEMINQIKKITDIPFDIHIMAENPEQYIEKYNVCKDDIISVHYESTPHIQKALSSIKQKGAKAAVAINPGTPIESIREILDDIDMVLVMTVNPGFAGQKLVPQCIEKITRMRRFLDGLGYTNIEIEVDGNCSFENIPKMMNAGADIFVAGSSSVFDPKLGIEKAMVKLREIIEP
ncbi:MAG: ribulose-phosphate 3-epimerase [Clostridia bacterium]|nr:ribulose-phosphate 3-epimerase [Clostridia bacterium]